uniref:Vascular cell adhesion protein 1 n=1 Tax=Ictidomys tridecemlineatus TaxID=43179 RepID=A0A287CTJ0_ICTTR
MISSSQQQLKMPVALFGASNIFWMVFAASQAFKIETSPESRILAQIGDSVSLTCSTTGCESPVFSWRTQIDSPLNGKVKTDGTNSTLIMDPVSFENEHSYLCTATCGSEKLEKGIQVEIYSFPKDPEIHFSGLLEVGKQVTVKCLIPDVYPFDRLEMDLWKDDHLMKNQEFLEDMDRKSLETKSLEVTFTPVMEDTGKALVCRAQLNIDETESVPQKRNTTKELQVYISPKNTVISVHPSTRLQEGDSVTMTCSSEGLPAPKIIWNKKLDNENLQLLSGNETLTLIAMRMEDSGTYVCEGVNSIGRSQKEVELIVEAFPRDPEIEMSGLLVNGNPVTVSCRVPNVYPFDHLEIELLNGETILMKKNFLEEMDRKSLETKSLEVTFTPTTEDSGKVLVCRAKLHTGEMESEHKQRQSTQTLYVNVAPKDIQLTVFPSESVKEGDTVIISCTCGNIPETWIILKKKAETGDTVLKSIDGAYTILKVQLEDAGVYECESKNEVGSQLRNLTLDVKGRDNTKDYFSPELLVLYCASSLIIPAIGMIIYFARKANMKGSYSLVEAQKSKV